MPRLIDVDELAKFPIRLNHYDRINGNEHYVFGIEAVLEYAENLPTIDAEPVTRCNMCKYYEAEVGFCHYHDHGMHWDDFCSRCAKMDLEVQDE